MDPPAPAVTQAIAAGPIDPADSLGRRDLDRLRDPAPCAAEVGWCTLPDGVAYAAVRTEMPGVTGEMIEWWFDWHPRDSLRYQIWFPGAHESTRFEPPPSASRRAHWGAVHYPVEDIGLGMDPLRIAFLPPSQLGFASDALDDPHVATIVGGLVGDERRHVQHTLMTHVFLTAADGVVLRSRFWIGAALRPYAPRPVADLAARVLVRHAVRKRLVPARTPLAMATHCAAEYANLAGLLPELYAAYGPPTVPPAAVSV